MQNLNYYKKIMQDKSKNLPFSDYLKYITSWQELSFYKIDGLVSRFPKTDRIAGIVKFKNFDEQIENSIKNVKNYNFSKNFFSNFEELFKSINMPDMIQFLENENSEYSDVVVWCKNNYLSNVTTNSENILYSFSIKKSRNVFNWVAIWKHSENIYYSSWINNSFNVFYSRYLINSNNIWFSTNLVWCSECIFCDNLDNQKYCINNKKLEKEEYLKQKKEILKNKKEFYNYYLKLNKKSWIFNSKNCNWNFILNWNEIDKWYFVTDTKNWKNLMFWWGDSENEFDYNIFTGWSWKNVHLYSNMWCWMWNEHIYNSAHIPYWNNIFYSYFVTNCSFCIWCIWLKNKSYCILNKQYTKGEWEELSSKIFETMEQDWTLWEFFPAKLNPFYFNDTVAGLIWWFKKEEIIKEGFMWRDEKIKVDIPDENIVLEISELDNYEGFDSNWNWRINPKILKKVIKSKNWDYYKIVKMEYDFLVKHWLPLPRLHWLDRMKVNFGV